MPHFTAEIQLVYPDRRPDIHEEAVVVRRPVLEGCAAPLRLPGVGRALPESQLKAYMKRNAPLRWKSSPMYVPDGEARVEESASAAAPSVVAED